MLHFAFAFKKLLHLLHKVWDVAAQALKIMDDIAAPPIVPQAHGKLCFSDSKKDGGKIVLVTYIGIM